MCDLLFVSILIKCVIIKTNIILHQLILFWNFTDIFLVIFYLILLLAVYPPLVEDNKIK